MIDLNGHKIMKTNFIEKSPREMIHDNKNEVVFLKIKFIGITLSALILIRLSVFKV